MKKTMHQALKSYLKTPFFVLSKRYEGNFYGEACFSVKVKTEKGTFEVPLLKGRDGYKPAR